MDDQGSILGTGHEKSPFTLIVSAYTHLRIGILFNALMQARITQRASRRFEYHELFDKNELLLELSGQYGFFDKVKISDRGTAGFQFHRKS